MVVAPMIVEVTFQRLLHQASASCVGVKPCFSATLAYSATASRANDLLYLPVPATCQLALSTCLKRVLGLQRNFTHTKLVQLTTKYSYGCPKAHT